MSYDLYFRKKNSKDFPLEEFKGYFESRPHYKVEKGQAIYENEDTGVYFIMEHNEINVPDDPTETPADISPANLNLNFVRPHVFALEAEPEVRAFVNQFDLLIYDPQNDGNATDIYDTEAFIRGYNVGNKFSYGAIIKNNPEIAKAVLPTADIEKYWNWNRRKNELQNQLGENIFVPKISFHTLNGKVRSLIVWSEAIPTAFPEVDTVIVFRQSMAPSSFFSKKKNDYTIVEPAQLASLLGDVIETVDGLRYRTLLSEDKARKWVLSLPASDTKPTLVSFDQVLDQELFN